MDFFANRLGWKYCYDAFFNQTVPKRFRTTNKHFPGGIFSHIVAQIFREIPQYHQDKGLGTRQTRTFNFYLIGC